MGNPTLFYPGDEPRPCWTCKHFIGLYTLPQSTWIAVNCAERGRFTQANADSGCRRWTELEPEPHPSAE